MASKTLVTAFLIGALGSTTYGLFQTKDEVRDAQKQVDSAIQTASAYVQQLVKQNETLQDRVSAFDKKISSLESDNKQLKSEVEELKQKQKAVESILRKVFEAEEPKQ